MKFAGLAINTAALDRVSDTHARGEGPEGDASLRIVTPEVIAATREQYPDCRCSELGLAAGMRVNALVELEAGCRGNPGRSRLSGEPMSHRDPPGYVCERLNKVRRIYGK